MVATNAGWITEVAQQTLRRVDAALGPNLTEDRAALGRTVDGLPDGVDVYIIDANARTLFATVPGAEQVDVSDREYFTALRDGTLFYTSGLLVSRVTGKQIFVFSRSIMRDGLFAGAIMMSFPNDVLGGFWSTLDLDPGSTVSLVRRDGQLIARYPAPPGPVDLSQHVLITTYLPQADSGSYRSDASPVDGVPRQVSYRVVPDTDIIALASIASDESWAELWSAVVAVIGIAAPILLGLIVGGIWIIRLLDRDARREEELRAALETNTLLFREIHHRVKNNLQSVQSLVRMQDMPKGAKVDLLSRLTAMAAMHEHIYRRDSYDDIDAHELVPAVIDDVVSSYGADIELIYALDHVVVDRDHMTPLSLLISELVTNALKYAFAGGRRGRLEVRLTDLGGGRCRLTVADDGPGMDRVPDASASMGMRLIEGLVLQMSGTHRFVTQRGTVFEAELALTTGGHRHPS